MQLSHFHVMFLDSLSHPAVTFLVHKIWSHAPEKISPVIENFLMGRVDPVIFGTYLIQDLRDPQVLLSQ